MLKKGQKTVNPIPESFISGFSLYFCYQNKGIIHTNYYLITKTMKTKEMIRMTTVVLLSAGLVSCSSKNKQEREAETVPVDYLCLFQGTLPCGDCPGIETKVTFQADSTAAITRLYLDSDGTSETEYGTWTYQDSTFVVETTSNDSIPVKETLCFKVLPDEQIALMGEDQIVKAENVLLKKQPLTLKDFEGSYTQGGEEKGAYTQTMTISPSEDNQVEVTIAQSGGKGKGCTFTGIGHIVNNQIEIDLQEIQPELNAVMVIRQNNEGNGLNVFTSDFDQRYDLMYFCGGGGSLAGDYIKK